MEWDKFMWDQGYVPVKLESDLECADILIETRSESLNGRLRAVSIHGSTPDGPVLHRIGSMLHPDLGTSETRAGLDGLLDDHTSTEDLADGFMKQDVGSLQMSMTPPPKFLSEILGLAGIQTEPDEVLTCSLGGVTRFKVEPEKIQEWIDAECEPTTSDQRFHWPEEEGKTLYIVFEILLARSLTITGVHGKWYRGGVQIPEGVVESTGPHSTSGHSLKLQTKCLRDGRLVVSAAEDSQLRSFAVGYNAVELSCDEAGLLVVDESVEVVRSAQGVTELVRGRFQKPYHTFARPDYSLHIESFRDDLGQSQSLFEGLKGEAQEGGQILLEGLQVEGDGVLSTAPEEQYSFTPEEDDDDHWSQRDAELPLYGVSFDDESFSDGVEEIQEPQMSPQLKNDELLQLTVEIYMDRRYVYWSKAQKAKLILKTSADGSEPRFLIGEPGNEKLTDVDPSLADFSMKAFMRIDFLYQPETEDRGRSKRMTTTIEVDYFMAGDISDDKKFGWYHDDLALSFEGERGGRAERVTRDIEKEILSATSKLELFTTGQAVEEGTHHTDGRFRRTKITAGFRTFINLQYTCGRKKDVTRVNTERTDSSVKMPALTLSSKSFSVVSAAKNEFSLKYNARIYPSLFYSNLWNKGYRDMLHSGGVMSHVPIKVQGDWRVLDDCEGASCSAGTSFGKYTFSCKRDLNLHIKLDPKGKDQNPKSKALLGRLYCCSSKCEVMSELCIEERTVVQILKRQLLLNHNFSHMERLRRARPYEWRVADGLQPIDEIVNVPTPECVQ